MNRRPIDDENGKETSSLKAIWAGAPKRPILIGTIVGGAIGIALALFILWLVKEKPVQYDPSLLEPVQAVRPRATSSPTPTR